MTAAWGLLHCVWGTKGKDVTFSHLSGCSSQSLTYLRLVDFPENISVPNQRVHVMLQRSVLQHLELIYSDISVIPFSKLERGLNSWSNRQRFSQRFISKPVHARKRGARFANFRLNFNDEGRSLATIEKVNRYRQMFLIVRDVQMHSPDSNPSTLIGFKRRARLIEAVYQSQNADNRGAGSYASDPIETLSLFKLRGAIVFSFGVLFFLFGGFLMSDDHWAGKSNLDLRWKAGWLLTAVGTAAVLLPVACLVAQLFSLKALL